MKLHKKKLKSLKMDAVSESMQGELATVNSKLATANYTINAMKDNFTTVKNLKIKGKLEQPEPTRYSENPFSLQQI